MGRLRNTYYGSGNYGGVVSVMRAMLERQKVAFGAVIDTEDVLPAMKEMSSTYYKLKDLQHHLSTEKDILIEHVRASQPSPKAMQMEEPDSIEAFLEMQRRMLRDDHPEALWTLSRLMELYRYHADNKKLAAVQQANLARQQRLLGEYHPDALSTMSQLIETYTKSGDYTGVATVLQTILAEQKQILGEYNEATLNTIKQLSAILTNSGTPSATWI